ncbi:MAG: DUF853 domain-containing protein, partial [Azoarcus sp.]|nr:DUF853 domain-containing protein [Azoarcus sp.]
DRESAYEKLKARQNVPDVPANEPRPPRRNGGNRESAMEAMTKSAARAIGSQIGRAILRGLLGSILGKRR